MKSGNKCEKVISTEPVNTNTLSCYDTDNDICVDYTFSNLSDKNNFENQCENAVFVKVISSCSINC